MSNNFENIRCAHYRNQRVYRVCHRNGRGAFGHGRPSAVRTHTAERARQWQRRQKLSVVCPRDKDTAEGLPCVYRHARHKKATSPSASRQWWGHHLPCARIDTAEGLPCFLICRVSGFDCQTTRGPTPWWVPLFAVWRVPSLPCPREVCRVFTLGKMTIWSKTGLPGLQFGDTCPLCCVQGHGRGLSSPLPCVCTW
jgi:hypothetical protein